MTNLEILVARHGETDWNKNSKWQGLSDIPLNESGIAQARKLGEILKGEKIDAIISSDLKRAKKTAEIVAEMLEVGNVRTDARLRERFLGKFEGWETDQVADYSGLPQAQRRLLETDEAFADNLESVEPWDNFRLKVWEAFKDIANSSSGSKTLIVGHGGVMRAIYLSINTDYEGFPNFKNCEFIRARKTEKGWYSEP